MDKFIVVNDTGLSKDTEIFTEEMGKFKVPIKSITFNPIKNRGSIKAHVVFDLSRFYFDNVIMKPDEKQLEEWNKYLNSMGYKIVKIEDDHA